MHSRLPIYLTGNPYAPDFRMELPIELVLNVMTQLLPKYPNVILPASHPITQTLLSFTLVCRETSRQSKRYLLRHCVYLSSEWRLRDFLLQLPENASLRNIPSMLLAPFGDTIDNQPIATWTRELFNYSCHSLKKLVIDIPLRSLYPERDHLDVRRILREGFQRLENLEEFVSVKDELFLDTTTHGSEPPVWKSWIKLKRLALYNVDADPDFWADISKMPDLETLVLTRADGLREHNIKLHFFEQAPKARKPLKVLIVNVEEDQVRFGNMRRVGWDYADKERKMTIMTYNVPRLYKDEDQIEVCQEYVRAGAENETLWEWEGEVIQHLPRIPTATGIRLLDSLEWISTV
jgi:hypothetical protein